MRQGLWCTVLCFSELVISYLPREVCLRSLVHAVVQLALALLRLGAARPCTKLFRDRRIGQGPTQSPWCCRAKHLPHSHHLMSLPIQGLQKKKPSLSSTVHVHTNMDRNYCFLLGREDGILLSLGWTNPKPSRMHFWLQRCEGYCVRAHACAYRSWSYSKVVLLSWEAEMLKSQEPYLQGAEAPSHRHFWILNKDVMGRGLFQIAICSSRRWGLS